MKDELIETINAKIKQNRRIMTASAFGLASIDILVMLLITHYKHPELVNIMDVTLVKSFFRNFS